MHNQKLDSLFLALACTLFSSSITIYSGVNAQTTSSSPSQGIPNYPTNSSSAAAFTTTIPLSLQDLWDLFVGPVSTPAITTTASATPVPSSSLIPPPPLYYNPFPVGAQVVAEVRNESWSFPKDFLWGVAGAAFQIEGAPDVEGRGPSVWDVLTHRVQGYVKDNTTADVTDNGYFLYKVGESSFARCHGRKGDADFPFSVRFSYVDTIY